MTRLEQYFYETVIKFLPKIVEELEKLNKNPISYESDKNMILYSLYTLFLIKNLQPSYKHQPAPYKKTKNIFPIPP